MGKITVDYTSKNIMEDEALDEVVYAFCEANWKDNYYSLDDMLTSVIAIEYFPNATFKDLLTQWYEEQGMDIADKVRCYFEYRKGFLMEHGCGYDWTDEDLYDGREREFKAWLDAKGFELVDD